MSKGGGGDKLPPIRQAIHQPELSPRSPAMSTDPLFPPPLLTADLPGIGGRIKVELEDFVVEEIPAYAPCGSGEHLFVWIEKRDLGADFFLRQIARTLGISPGAVGCAGLKDRRAVTRQWLSLPVTVAEHLPRLAELPGVKVLTVSRHGNKLRPGHLHGNRFTILIRDIDPALPVAERLPPILARLRRLGLPNFYGPQRFGREGDSALAGLALLRHEPVPLLAQGRKQNVRNPFVRKFVLSAAQALLFNRYLARRMEMGLFRTVLAGDVMSKWPAGGLFVATDVAREQQRFDARETVTTGPIFGRKTFAAQGDAARREAEVLAEFGLSPTSFHEFGKLMQGTRRHNLIYVDDLHCNWQAGEGNQPGSAGVRLSFTLPAGSYATILLREIMKNAAAEGADGEAENAGENT